MTPLSPDWDSPYHSVRSLLGIPSPPSRFRHLGRNTAQWEERVALLAKWISLEGTVLDLGCGQMTLERHLPPQTSYLPVDFVRRDHRTHLVDLNGPLPRFPGTVAVLSGVLEYIHHLEPLVGAMTESRQILFSYCTREQFPWKLTRVARGWVNHWYHAEVVDHFERWGFRLHRSARVGKNTVFDVRR